MKRMYMIIIIIILALLVGAYIFSPFSPMNKANINGETITLPSGYTVKNTTSTSTTISNGTNEIIIMTGYNSTSELEASVIGYKEKFNTKYNITDSLVKMDNNQEVYKTVAVTEKNNEIITKYWFIHDNILYNIQSNNPDSNTENVIKDMISSL